MEYQRWKGGSCPISESPLHQVPSHVGFWERGPAAFRGRPFPPQSGSSERLSGSSSPVGPPVSALPAPREATPPAGPGLPQPPPPSTSYLPPLSRPPASFPGFWHSTAQSSALPTPRQQRLSWGPADPVLMRTASVVRKKGEVEAASLACLSAGSVWDLAIQPSAKTSCPKDTQHPGGFPSPPPHQA